MRIKKSSYSYLIWLCLTTAVFTALKLILISKIPIIAYTTAAQDDRAMVMQALSLLKGEYLGVYNHYTLIKGISFPLFLAASYTLGIPYAFATNLYYSIGVIVFFLAVSPVFKPKNRFMWVVYSLVLIGLIFNPCTYTQAAIQRVYRNCLTASQLLIITGSMFALFINRNEKTGKWLPWLLIGYFPAFVFFFFTREDSMWIFAFIIAVTVITSIFMIKERTKQKTKAVVTKIVLLFCVFPLLFISKTCIRAINYHYYGVYTVSELTDSNFSRALKNMYAVKPEPGEETDRMTVSVAKLERLYKISPSLNDIKDEMEYWYATWVERTSTGDETERDDGLFFWYLREAAYSAGYYTDGKTANEYWGRVADEIDAAFENGTVEKRKGMLPSALMSPIKENTVKNTFASWKEAIIFCLKYYAFVPFSEYSVDDGGAGIALFEEITLSKAYRNPDDTIDPHIKNEIEYRNRIYDRRIHIVRKMTAVYCVLGPKYEMAGVLFYLIFSGFCLYGLIKKQKDAQAKRMRAAWLIITALLGAFLAVTAVVAYDDAVAAYGVISQNYLTGAYPMSWMFTGLSVLCGGGILLEKVLMWCKRPSKGKKRA